MPIYEFDCHGCGESFDKLVRLNRESEVTCPSCESEHVKKKLSLFSSKVSGGTRSSVASAPANCAPGGL
jgi:putative FmdB family regulatory protein